MNRALAKNGQAGTALQITGQDELIRQFISKDNPPADIVQFFLYTCKRTGLDPIARQIYLIKRGDKFTIQTSIDGMRLVADRTGVYAGSDDAIFVEKNDKPLAATITVYKLVQGQKCAFTATARFSEYFQPRNEKWQSMPYTMLAKCAESLALRKGFPADLSGIYSNEEMDQASPMIVDSSTGEVIDETEVETIPKASAVSVNPETGEIAEQAETRKLNASEAVRFRLAHLMDKACGLPKGDPETRHLRIALYQKWADNAEVGGMSDLSDEQVKNLTEYLATDDGREKVKRFLAKRYTDPFSPDADEQSPTAAESAGVVK